MSPDVWKQATLPIAMGGLGLQKAADTALPAYVSSLISAMPTVESIVPESRLSDKVAELSARWSTETDKTPHQPRIKHVSLRGQRCAMHKLQILSWKTPT